MGEDRQVTSASRFPYSGDGTADTEPVTHVELRPDEYGGPFWDDAGCLGDDWTLWQSMGLTRDTYDACMRWSGDATQKAVLLRRLRQELPESIAVEKPYEPEA
jgi:hypothetical protein